MKLQRKRYEYINNMSLPVRGAWVEIVMDGYVLTSDFGRSPCGERGLKWC